MGREKSMTLSRKVELKLYAYRKNRDGLIVSFVVHPNDEDFLNGVHIGQVYQAELEPTGGEEEAPRPPTEGERLRTRAVLLCKDERFQEWCNQCIGGRSYDHWDEEMARQVILSQCGIDSRSELALSIPAQEKFRNLERQFREETGQAAERRGG
jgi:hypothetical protein